jgi:hypothetical protein
MAILGFLGSMLASPRIRNVGDFSQLLPRLILGTVYVVPLALLSRCFSFWLFSAGAPPTAHVWLIVVDRWCDQAISPTIALKRINAIYSIATSERGVELRALGRKPASRAESKPFEKIALGGSLGGRTNM